MKHNQIVIIADLCRQFLVGERFSAGFCYIMLFFEPSCDSLTDRICDLAFHHYNFRVVMCSCSLTGRDRSPGRFVYISSGLLSTAPLSAEVTRYE